MVLEIRVVEIWLVEIGLVETGQEERYRLGWGAGVLGGGEQLGRLEQGCLSGPRGEEGHSARTA